MTTPFALARNSAMVLLLWAGGRRPLLVSLIDSMAFRYLIFLEPVLLYASLRQAWTIGSSRTVLVVRGVLKDTSRSVVGLIAAALTAGPSRRSQHRYQISRSLERPRTTTVDLEILLQSSTFERQIFKFDQFVSFD